MRSPDSAGAPVGVITIDDYPVFRQGMRHLLEVEEGIRPLGELESVEHALAWLERQRADVALLDHNLPGISGIDGIPLLHRLQPDLQIIVLTVCDDDQALVRAIRRGACGYMVKDAPPDHLLDAIRAAARGECRIAGRLTHVLFRHLIPDGQPVEQGTSAHNARGREGNLHPCPPGREREVLVYLLKGMSNKEIARALDISPNTVRNHLQRLQERFNARNRVQLALLARGMGIG